MSIRARIDDTKILWKEGRHEGALLSVLIAIAATSKRRYSKLGDGEAFRKFVQDEFETIFGISVKDSFNVDFRGTSLPLENLLYKFVRCELAHEAALPADVVFEPTQELAIRTQGNRIVFAGPWADKLATAVVLSPENEDGFPEAAQARANRPKPRISAGTINLRGGTIRFEKPPDRKP